LSAIGAKVQGYAGKRLYIVVPPPTILISTVCKERKEIERKIAQVTVMLKDVERT